MERDNKQAKKAGITKRPHASSGRVSASDVHRKQAASTARRGKKPTAARAAVKTEPLDAEAKKFLLPKYHAPVRPQRIVRKRLSRTMLGLRIASAVVAVFLVTGGFLAWKGYAKFHKVFHGTTTVAALSKKTVAPDLLKGEGDGRVNILLLGVGGPGHDGPDLTDTIVVLSVDPVNGTAAMISIPRDLWVNMPVNYFGSQQKINAAYESGKYHYLGKLDASNSSAPAVEAGFDAIDTTLKDVLDVNINYHLLVNFQAFRQAIDAVGGVTVDVPTQLYDPTMAWENHNSPILADVGVQQMDGVKALLYARSRETTSDFARSQRQRQILIALKDKVLTAGTLSNPTKIDALMNAFGDNVYSDLSTQGATRLVGIMKKVSDTKVNSVGLTDEPHKLVTTDRVGTASVVRPIAGLGNYTDIQAYVRSQIPDGYLLKEHAPLLVVGSTAAGAAATAAILTNYGYTVAATSTTTAAIAQPIVVDRSNGKDPYTLHYLEARYGVTAVKSLPAGLGVTPGSAKFVIIESK
jgi:LCP family protein required for cell wall assembly